MKNFTLVKFQLWKTISEKYPQLKPTWVAEIFEKFEYIRPLLFYEYYTVEEKIQMKFSKKIRKNPKLKPYFQSLENQIQIERFVKDFFDCFTIYQNYYNFCQKYRYRINMDFEFFELLLQEIEVIIEKDVENVRQFLLDLKVKFGIYEMVNGNQRQLYTYF